MTSLSSLGYMRNCVLALHWTTSIPQSEGSNSTEPILDSCSALLLDQYCLYKGSDLSVTALPANWPLRAWRGGGHRGIIVGPFPLRYIINEQKKALYPFYYFPMLSGNWQNNNFDSEGLSSLEHYHVCLILFLPFLPISMLLTALLISQSMWAVHTVVEDKVVVVEGCFILDPLKPQM